MQTGFIFPKPVTVPPRPRLGKRRDKGIQAQTSEQLCAHPLEEKKSWKELKPWVKMRTMGSLGPPGRRKHFLERRTALRVCRVLSLAGPVLLSNIRPSGLFRLFVIYNEVQSPGSVCFVPWSVSLRNSHSMPSIPSPTFNQHPIGIWYTHDLGNSLPCWDKCQLRFWICKRHNPNTKILLPKAILFPIHFPNHSTTC